MKRRHGLAGFVAVSAAMHAAAAVILSGVPVRLAPKGSAAAPAIAAGSTAPAPRLRSALRGAFHVVALHVDDAVAAAPDLEERARATRERDAARSADARESGAAADAEGSAWDALAAAMLSSESMGVGPRTTGPETTGPGRFVPPVPVRVVWPEFPPSARRGRAGGSVLVRVHVTRQGLVDSVRVERPLPEPALNAAAMEAARHLLFEPARMDGRPVDYWFTYPVTFAP